MASALIGYSGYVGSSLLRQAVFDERFRSTTVGDVGRQPFDLVVCAAARSKKWLANMHPDDDFLHIEHLCTSLNKVTCGLFVLISTVDVFSVPIAVDESSEVREDGLHPYGLNRRRLEKHVEDRFPNHLIIRLAGLVGPGLRKNIVYDLLHGNNVDAIDARATFQFYPMVNLWPDIEVAIASGIRLVHLTAEPLSAADVAQHGFGTDVQAATDGPAVRYDMQSVHAGRYGAPGRYQYSKRESLLAIRAYAQSAGAAAGPEPTP